MGAFDTLTGLLGAIIGGGQSVEIQRNPQGDYLIRAGNQAMRLNEMDIIYWSEYQLAQVAALARANPVASDWVKKNLPDVRKLMGQPLHCRYCRGTPESCWEGFCPSCLNGYVGNDYRERP